MKRIITGLILTLPLVFTSFSKPASALSVTNNTQVDKYTDGVVYIADYDRRDREDEQRYDRRRDDRYRQRRSFIPGHYEYSRYYGRRVFVPGHYIYR